MRRTKPPLHTPQVARQHRFARQRAKSLNVRGFEGVEFLVQFLDLFFLLLARFYKLFDKFFDALLETVACVQTSNVAPNGF